MKIIGSAVMQTRSLRGSIPQPRSLGLIMLFVGCLAWPEAAVGQRPIYGVSTDEVDPRALFANPALLTFQRAKVGLGAKSYHFGLGDAGLSDLGQGYMVVSAPALWRDFLGGGLGVQYFSSPIYRRTRIALGTSFRFLRFASVGGDAGFMQVSYNQSNFQLEEPNDPVFAGGTSKAAPTFSVGAFVNPFHFLSFSVGIRDINNPNVNLGSGQSVPLQEPYGGVTFSWGPFRSTLEVINGIRTGGTGWQTHLEYFFTGDSFLRLSSYAMGSEGLPNIGQVEAHVRVFGPFSVQYAYELPPDLSGASALSGLSTGSHQLGFVYDFGRRSPSQDVVSPAFPLAIEQPTEDITPPEPRAYLSAADEQITISEKIITLEVDPALSESEHGVGNLSALDAEMLASSLAVAEALPAAPPGIAPLIDVPEAERLSPEYEDVLQDVGRDLAEGEGTFEIIADPSAAQRGERVRDVLVEQGGAMDDRVRIDVANLALLESLLSGEPSDPPDPSPNQIRVREPGQTTFRVYFFYMDASVVSDWSFTLYDAMGSVVRRVDATMPGVTQSSFGLTWEWDRTNEEGEPIEPGYYQGRFEWTTATGETRESNVHQVMVLKRVRHVTYRIMDRPTEVEGTPERLILRR